MALTEQEITKQLNELLYFLEPFKCMLNSHLGSFLVEDIWERQVPSEIQLELNNLKSVTNFIQLFPQIIKNNCPNNFAEDHPNLINFLKETLKVSIFKKEKFVKLLMHLESMIKSENKFRSHDSEMEKLMALKKRHEVKITSNMVALISNLTQSSHIVDVGGGKGYLSCSLVLNYSFKVLGMDFSEVTTSGAIKRSGNLARLWDGKILKAPKNAQHEKIFNKKAREKFIQNQYKQVTTFVTPDTNTENFLRDNFNEEIDGITLSGLHTCGDLAPTCLRMFLRGSKSRGIINVGCCYNLISEEFVNESSEENLDANVKNYGFPMSHFLREKKYKLGQNARMVACHSLDRFSLNSEFEFSQTSLFHRAILEIILKEMSISANERKIGKFGKKSNNFHQYMSAAFKKLGISSNLTKNDLEKLYECYLNKKPLLTAFYLLRISLAPVVESIILLDRILYLTENDINNVYLVPLFDLEISPRGFGIIAWKDLRKSQFS